LFALGSVINNNVKGAQNALHDIHRNVNLLPYTPCPQKVTTFAKQLLITFTFFSDYCSILPGLISVHDLVSIVQPGDSFRNTYWKLPSCQVSGI